MAEPKVREIKTKTGTIYRRVEPEAGEPYWEKVSSGGTIGISEPIIRKDSKDRPRFVYDLRGEKHYSSPILDGELEKLST